MELESYFDFIQEDVIWNRGYHRKCADMETRRI